MAQKKSYTLDEIADLLDLKLIGDGRSEVNGLGTLKNAGPGHLSFLSNRAYVSQLTGSKASAIILRDEFVDACPTNALVASDPYAAYARASALFDRTPIPTASVHPSAVVEDGVEYDETVCIGANAVIEAGASIGSNSVIGPNCVVGRECRIGNDCRLYNSVSLYHEVVLGDRVIIHSGAVIGADGFGFAFDGARSLKIHQLGGVRIGNDVEIGAGTTIDRGAIDDTRIGTGVKIDNQVQIGHNCQIGEHSIICGCTAIAGSVTIGKNCIMGGASGAVGHISIADGVQVSAMSLVSQSIEEAGTYSSGTGHMKTSDWKRNIVRFQQLDSIAKRLKELEKITDKRADKE